MARRATIISEALRQRRIDDAERGAIAAFALAPKHPEILYLFGRVQALRGQHEQAVSFFLQAQALRPNDALIWSHLGVALEEVKDFDRANELSPQDPEVLIRRAYALAELKRPKEVLADLQVVNVFEAPNDLSTQLHDWAVKASKVQH